MCTDILCTLRAAMCIQNFILPFNLKKMPAWCTLRVRMVNLSRATTLSKFFSSISFMYISYSSWRWGGTRRLWSAKSSFTLIFHNYICSVYLKIYIYSFIPIYKNNYFCLNTFSYCIIWKTLLQQFGLIHLWLRFLCHFLFLRMTHHR